MAPSRRVVRTPSASPHSDKDGAGADAARVGRATPEGRGRRRVPASSFGVAPPLPVGGRRAPQGTQTEFWQFGALEGQTTPQAPQWVGLLVTLISQPSAGLLLQLAKPGLHAPTAHMLFWQVRVPFATRAQARPQPPQLSTSEARLTSQPSTWLPLQLAKPALHAPSGARPAQAGPGAVRHRGAGATAAAAVVEVGGQLPLAAVGERRRRSRRSRGCRSRPRRRPAEQPEAALA